MAAADMEKMPIEGDNDPMEHEEGWYLDANDRPYYLYSNGNEYYPDEQRTDNNPSDDEAGWFLDANDNKYFVDGNGVEYYYSPQNATAVGVPCVQDQDGIAYFAEQQQPGTESSGSDWGWYLDAEDEKYFVDVNGTEYYPQSQANGNGHPPPCMA